MKLKITAVTTMVVIFSFTIAAMAQQGAGDTAPPKDSGEGSGFTPRVIWGGAAYLNFWNSRKTLGISPTVGYLWAPKVYSGIGISYLYSWSDDYSSSTIGGRLFTNYYVVPQAFLRAEFEYDYVSWKTGIWDGSYWVPYLWLGAGYRQRVGSNTYLEIHAVVDVLNDANSSYKKWDPSIGVGIVTGF